MHVTHNVATANLKFEGSEAIVNFLARVQQTSVKNNNDPAAIAFPTDRGKMPNADPTTEIRLALKVSPKTSVPKTPMRSLTRRLGIRNGE